MAGSSWRWALLLSVFSFVSQSLCVWPAPRFLGAVAQLLLMVFWPFTVLLFLAALPASAYFVVIGLMDRKVPGAWVRQLSQALACLCFFGLWILSMGSATSLRHRAFVRASHAGDRVVRALARYRSDRGEYPERLEPLIPGYLERTPYTGMIGYPEFAYHKNRNDIATRAGTYELRIDCPSGGINFDRFIYWPSETYPDRIQDNRVERIGRWAYVHE